MCNIIGREVLESIKNNKPLAFCENLRKLYSPTNNSNPPRINAKTQAIAGPRAIGKVKYSQPHLTVGGVVVILGFGVGLVELSAANEGLAQLIVEINAVQRNHRSFFVSRSTELSLTPSI